MEAWKLARVLIGRQHRGTGDQSWNCGSQLCQQIFERESQGRTRHLLHRTPRHYDASRNLSYPENGCDDFFPFLLCSYNESQFLTIKYLGRLREVSVIHHSVVIINCVGPRADM